MYIHKSIDLRLALAGMPFDGGGEAPPTFAADH